MKTLILYNWEVRDEYFKAFQGISQEELMKDRKAGAGSILKTFLHIIDVEYSWVRAMYNKPDRPIDFAQYGDLQAVAMLSNQWRGEIIEYLDHWTNEELDNHIKPSWMQETYRKEEIVKHLIVHEVHHIGQLSIWARELGIVPVNSNFIGRDLMNKARNM